ncbi:hypothetical protein [Membranihabitans marinus]|uniref:hypothetical protein n=1 Tax=Membranihabitans marinus TaxID=1227546 RepID=UPI001F457B86|nr:hypothetical protein [Membranihabitans marinus]
MKTKYLFPHSFKIIGWIVFIPSVLIGLWVLIKEIEPDFLDRSVFALFIDDWDEERFMGVLTNNILNEIMAVLVIVSGLLVAFSKEKYEDEYIAKIRLESLVWATYVNYGILLLAVIFVYDFSFFWVMIFNMFTILLFFIVRFHYLVWRINKNQES